jgi:hypothetical protein
MEQQFSDHARLWQRPETISASQHFRFFLKHLAVLKAGIVTQNRSRVYQIKSCRPAAVLLPCSNPPAGFIMTH